MSILDVFGSDAFGVRSLTDAINKLKYVPGFISGAGLFSASGVPTTTIAIEEKDGVLTLVAPTPRGGPGITLDKTLRTLRPFLIRHFEINDAIMAEEVQGIRAFGQESQTETVMEKVAERMMYALQSHAYTEEYMRLGAIKGTVTYADSTTLNLFTEFNVSQISEQSIVFSTSADTGVIRAGLSAIIRLIAGVLDGVPWAGGVTALCSDTYYDALIQSHEVRATFLNQAEAADLRMAAIDSGQSGAYGRFTYGGVQFINYRGTGGTGSITEGKAHFFPTGVPNLFRTYYAPADYIETVNTIGLPRYAKQYAMPNDKGIHFDTQMNGLNICTRPRTLIQGAFTTS
jgi:hypothetical protein